eukprot:2712848-Prymnesium_polylepis.1
MANTKADAARAAREKELEKGALADFTDKLRRATEEARRAKEALVRERDKNNHEREMIANNMRKLAAAVQAELAKRPVRGARAHAPIAR